MGDKKPAVVVGVLVLKGNCVLLGKRKQGDGRGEYAGPGGTLRFGETLEACAERKVQEETGLHVENVRVVSFLNALHWQDAHYIDIEAVCHWVSGEPKVSDLEAFDSWDWYDIENHPEPLIIGDKKGLEALKTGQMYFGTNT